MSDIDIRSKLIDHKEFCGFNVKVQYSKQYFLSGDELLLNVTFRRSELQGLSSTLHCISIYLYGIAIFSSKILNGDTEAKEFEISFSKECVTFPFLTAELDNINKDDRLRLIFSTDAALIEPSISTEDNNFVDKIYKLKIRLPPFLPPSFFGKYTKIKYSTCLSAQHYKNGNFQRIYLQFPFTLIGALSSKLPTMDRSYLPIRTVISNITNADDDNGDSSELYNKIYDWWLLMNEDSGFDYEGIGAANFKKYIYNFLLQGVEAVDLPNQVDLNYGDLLDYETLVEQRKMHAIITDFSLLKIGSNGIDLCTIKLYGTDNCVIADSDNNLIIKLNSLLKMDFEFYSDKYTLKLVRISLTSHEAYRLDLDDPNRSVKGGESENSFLSVHCLQKVVTPPYKKIYNKTVLKRFIYCSSYDSTSLTLHIPYLEPSFNWDDIAFYYKLNFYFHISDNTTLGNNKVEVSPFSKYKAGSYTVNTILIP